MGPPQVLSLPAARSGRANLAIAASLIVGLLGVAWFSSDYFRESWLPDQPEVVVADASGEASMRGVTASISEFVDLGAGPDISDPDWQTPAGYHLWQVTINVASSNTDTVFCKVQVVDDQDRVFEAGAFVPSFIDGYETWLGCDGEDPELAPRQAMLVLLPADAVPESIRITDIGYSTDYLEFPID